MPPAVLRPPLLLALAALGAAAVALGAASYGSEVGPEALRLPGAAPASIVAGGESPWTRGGPTGRAALHGGWRVRLDPAAHGARERWTRGGFGGKPVSLPYAVNARSLTARSFAGSVAWYERDLRVPRSGRYVLRFGSVNHRAAVWLDGRRIGGHVGTYVPFELPVTLTAGRAHRLVVRADWRDPAEMKREGWHRTWFNFGGINRDVTLRPLGDSELAAPTVHTTLRGGQARVAITIAARNLRPVARAVPVTGALVRPGVRIPFHMAGVRTAPGDAQVLRATVDVPKPALWSPARPSLYDLQLVAGAGESGYRTAIGLRELTWNRAGELRLNGRPLRLRGASLQEDARGRGDALRPGDQSALARELVRLGANTTRAQHPLDEGLLERLDAAGVFVWLGVGPVDSPGSWTSRTARARRLARQRTVAGIREAQPHPSVIAYNLVNEMAGQGHDDTQRAYLRAMAREVHRRDPGRLVAFDVWGAHPPHHPGGIYRAADAVGVTNYTGWYEDTFASRGKLRQVLQAKLTRLRELFPGKVLIVSEFGAEGNRRNPTARPGGLEFQARLLRTHLAVYARRLGLAGALVWSLRDFAVAPSFAGGSIHRIVPGIRLVKGLNQKGVLTYGGRDKPAAAAVRRAFAGFGGR